MDLVYGELSAITHFRHTAMWMSHSVASEEERRTIWTNTPRWREQRDGLIACAQTLEIANAMEATLQDFVERHVLTAAKPDQAR